MRAQDGLRLHAGEISALLEMEAGRQQDWTSAEVQARNPGAEIMLLARGDANRAAQFFADAAGCAERQGARSWALRTALSRAQSAKDQGRSAGPRSISRACFRDSRGGRETADVQAASRVPIETA